MTRHSWQLVEPKPLYKTERVCRHCGLIKITNHSGPGIPWTEWDHPKAPAGVVWPKNTPVCPPREIEKRTAA